MDSSCYVRGSVRCCALLVRHAMPRAFLSCWSSLRYVLVSYGCVAPGVCATRVECAVRYSAPASLIQPGVSLGKLLILSNSSLHYLPQL